MATFFIFLVSCLGRCIVGQVLGSSCASGCLFVCFEQTSLKAQKTGLLTNLLITYNLQLCLVFILRPRIIKLRDDSYRGSYNE